MSTRTRMTTIWCGLVATITIALVAAQVGLSLQTQTLLAPSFTAAQSTSKKSVWMMRQRAPQSSGVLATAGGVIFAGALDRVFAAYDDASGRELWRVRLNDVPNSAPISYQVNGKQYIAVVTGNGGAQAPTFPALVPEIQNPPDRGGIHMGVRIARPAGATVVPPGPPLKEIL